MDRISPFPYIRVRSAFACRAGRGLKGKRCPGGAIWENVSVSTRGAFPGARVDAEQVWRLPALIAACLCS